MRLYHLFVCLLCWITEWKIMNFSAQYTHFSSFTFTCGSVVLQTPPPWYLELDQSRSTHVGMATGRLGISCFVWLAAGLLGRDCCESGWAHTSHWCLIRVGSGEFGVSLCCCFSKSRAVLSSDQEKSLLLNNTFTFGGWTKCRPIWRCHINHIYQVD